MSAMKSRAYVFVFDGLADWEPALALCEIRKSGKYEVLAVGHSRKTVITMGGLKVQPDISIDEIEPHETAIFLVPGGERWEKAADPKVEDALIRLHEEKVLIGAICAATLEIARAGLTRGLRHTSNAKSFLKDMVPEYKDDRNYVEELAVTNQNIITASGLGSVEFAREIIRELKIYSDADTRMWFEMFKNGVIPASMR
jgi:putative intracellular protease/amidase